MASIRKVGNKKLFELKKWLDFREAAQHLSIFFGEEVTKADVLKLVLNGYLKLSVRSMQGTPAKLCQGNIADLGDPPETRGMQDLYWLGRMLKAEDKICHLKEMLYDLPMIGAERSIVNHMWQQLNGDPVEEYVHVLETVVEGQEGELYLLQKLYFNDESTVDFIDGELTVKPHSGTGDYGPSNGFPVGSELVVRTSALHQLEESFVGEGAEELAGENTEQSAEVKTEKDTTKHKKQNSAKKPNNKKSDLHIVDAGVELLQPGRDDEELPSKGQAVSESGYLRLKQIIGNPKKGISAIIPVSRSTWWEGVKSGRYPKQVPLSDRTVGWKKSEIMALQEELEKGAE